MRARSAEHVEVNVAQDSKERGLEIRAGLKSPLRSEGAGDRFLSQVLSRLPVASQRPGEAEQPRPQVHDLSGKIALVLGAPFTHSGGHAPSPIREYPCPGGAKSRPLAAKGA